MMKKIECTIFRGGTSRGVFFREELLPEKGGSRDSLLLSVMGSPDIRQIDGLGGAVSTTSKVAIISRSERTDADVDYTFAQVSIDKPIVDYNGNCGNMSSAVGPYALEAGLVEAVNPETVVRIYNTNTSKIIHSYVPTPGGRVEYYGDFSISGVPGTASKIKLAFMNPAGAVTGKLLPTGSPYDIIDVKGIGKIGISIVDVTNPAVFVKAEDAGLEGTELSDAIDSNPVLLERLERIRGAAAYLLGFIDDPDQSSVKSPAVPKMTIISESKSYISSSGVKISKEEIDITGRMMSMQKTHKTYALTGALCTAGAAVIEGTIVNRFIKSGFNPESVLIGHPGGIIPAGVIAERENQGDLNIAWAVGYRTARLIMQGTVYYK